MSSLLWSRPCRLVIASNMLGPSSPIRKLGNNIKGDKPGDLPVQQSTNGTQPATALGIDVPPATLLRANEVIE